MLEKQESTMENSEKTVTAQPQSEFNPHKAKHKKILKRLTLALSVRLFIMAAELIGGILAQSLAVVTDSSEKFTDALSIFISIYAVCLADKAPKSKYSYGYHRAGVIGALISVALMWVIAGVLLYSAVLRILDLDSFEVDGPIMCITTVASLTVDLITMCILRSCGKKTEHQEPLIEKNENKKDSDSGDSSELDYIPPRRRSTSSIGGNENLRAVIMDIIGDMFQALLVIASSVLIWIDPTKYKIADPICTFIFPIVVFFATKPVTQDCVRILMEAAPEDLYLAKFKLALENLEGVVDVHDIHLWNVNNDLIVGSAHLRVREEVRNTILSEALKTCKRYGIKHATLQIEAASVEMQGYVDCNMHH